MSVSTSQNCQKSNPSLIEVELYEGIEEIEYAWRNGLTPDPDLLVSEWSDQYRMLSAKASNESGRWRTERTPYLKEIMDSLSPSCATERIAFMKGAQIGATECGNNWIGYVIHQAPGPFLAVSPTVEMAKRNSRQKIESLISDCPELSERVLPARARDSGNTVMSKNYPGGILVMTGANSAVGLRSASCRYLFADEADGYPAGDLDGEGDALFLAERRTATYRRRRKIFIVSTPTEKSTSRIYREFEASDKRYFNLPCPNCNEKIVLKFSQFRWEKGKPETVYYCCEHCEQPIHEHQKTKMLAEGVWVATAESKTRGYHLSSLYSPVGWYSWEDAVVDFEKAVDDPELIKTFKNTVLGEVHEDEFDAPEWERLYERREKYPIGIVPEGGLFLTAGVDIQRSPPRIECEIVAWGRNKESWSVDYQVLEGNVAEQGVWKKLKKLLEKDWPTASGATLPIRVMCVDSGYATQDVYNWVKEFPQAVWGGSGARAPHPRTVVAIKGRDSETAIVSSVSKVSLEGKRQGLRLWNLGVSLLKGELYRWLKLPRPTDEDLEKGEGFPTGSCHFPEYGEEFFKQITAEKWVIRFVKGFPKGGWEKEPTRNNEVLDCRCYARTGANLFGIDRFKEVQWKRMEQALGEAVSRERTEQKSSKQDISKLFAPPSPGVSDPYL